MHSLNINHQEMNEVQHIIARYLVGDDTIAVSPEFTTRTISHEKIACLKEYMVEINLSKKSQEGLTRFMKHHFNIESEASAAAAYDYLGDDQSAPTSKRR